MIIDDMIYVINVGDSRAFMSIDSGAQIGVLSRDHKPDDELEKMLVSASQNGFSSFIFPSAVLLVLLAFIL